MRGGHRGGMVGDWVVDPKMGWRDRGTPAGPTVL